MMKPIYWIILLVFFGCQQKQQEAPPKIHLLAQEKKVYHIDNIFADNLFDGARLNDFIKINDTTFQAIISPENIPINKSPWFAFRLKAEEKSNIHLEITYTHHGHRYIPKTSFDGKNWQPLDATTFEIDTAEQKITIQLQLDVKPLWIAAQEVISAEDTYQWMDKIVQLPFVEKRIIGKTVLEKPIYSLEVNEGKKEKTMVIIGRQHPPEIPGGTLSLQSFVEELLNESNLSKQFQAQHEILIVPLLNPDGVDLGHWRHNANGMDLNRDWQLFSQPETQAVRTWLMEKDKERKRDFCFGIDFHTSYSGPYLLVLDSLNEANSKGLIPTWIQKIEATIPNYKLDKRPRSQDLPYCYDWMYNELKMEAVTFEEGDEIDRAVIKNRAEIYARTLMETLLE